MDEREQTATLSKLMSREKFYKDKALRLERDYVFAKEQIEAMEARIKDLSDQLKEVDYEGAEGLKEQASYFEKKEADYLQKQNELLEEIQALKKDRIEATQDPNYQEKVEGYETLLTEVQETINEKEKECLVLKHRIETLEKRLKQRQHPADHDPSLFLNSGGESHTFGETAISYIDHAVILRDETCLIRGDCVIKNIGNQLLETPVVCFRIDPIEATTIKGKIEFLENTHASLLNEDEWHWSYVQNEWSAEAKERGEIWIAPTRPIHLEPNQEITLPDLQFLVEKSYYPKLTIECFIYFGESQLKIKTLNSILVNF